MWRDTGAIGKIMKSYCLIGFLSLLALGCNPLDGLSDTTKKIVGRIPSPDRSVDVVVIYEEGFRADDTHLYIVKHGEAPRDSDNDMFLSAENEVNRDGMMGMDIHWTSSGKLLISCKSAHVYKYDNAPHVGNIGEAPCVGVRLIIDDFGNAILPL